MKRPKKRKTWIRFTPAERLEVERLCERAQAGGYVDLDRAGVLAEKNHPEFTKIHARVAAAQEALEAFCGYTGNRVRQTKTR